MMAVLGRSNKSAQGEDWGGVVDCATKMEELMSGCRNKSNGSACAVRVLRSGLKPVGSDEGRARSALATASGGSRGDAEHRKPPSASALSHISAASNRSMARICWVDAMSPALSRDNADTDGGGSGRRAWVAGRRYGAPGYVPGARPGRINGHLSGPPDRWGSAA